MSNVSQKDLSNLSQEWLQIKKLSIKYSSYCKYESIIHLYVDPFLQKSAIDELNEVAIAAFMDELINQKKLSVSLIHSIKHVLHSVYSYGERQYGLKHMNFSYVKINKKTEMKMALTEDEERSLYQYCQNYYNKISIAIFLGLYAGLRLGEICGLQWKDIDFNHGIIDVNKTVQRLKNTHSASSKTELLISDPKTMTSNRNVVMPDFLTEYLKAYYLFSDVQAEDLQHFILSNSDKIQEPRTIQRQFKRICQLYEIDATFHVLRHTFATNCIKTGIDIKTVSEILGHSSVNITLNRYVHPSLDYKKEQMNKIKVPKIS